MPTIYDVAKLAGVSIGTVSKYINSKGYISPERRGRIKDAIERLNYIPNRAAKHLKLMDTSDIAVILPNLNEKVYREIFTGLSSVLTPDYRILIYLTNDIKSLETQIINECLSNNCTGMMLCTCQPKNTELFDEVAGKCKLFFLLREPVERLRYNYIGFDDANTIYNITNEILKISGGDMALFTGSVEFSGEANCIAAFKKAHMAYGITPGGEHILSYPFSRESTFRKAMKLFSSGAYPKIFITTSPLTAQAISEVAHFQNITLGEGIYIISLGEETYFSSVFPANIICTFRDGQMLGKECALKLLDSLNETSFSEVSCTIYDDPFPAEKISSFIEKRRGTRSSARGAKPPASLRLLLNEGDAGTPALKCLIPSFCREENIYVEIETLPHSSLYDKIVSDPDGYDIFTVDYPWLPYLGGNGVLLDLKGQGSVLGLFGNMQEGVQKAFGGEHIWGIPYIYTVSLLYYRKDLFTSEKMRALFYKEHKKELKPPENWLEFNIIARFFTQKYNRHSPTLYGTGIFGNFATAIMTELYPRIWSYGGGVFDKNGYVQLYSDSNLRAVENLVETIKYSNPDALKYKAFDSITDFMNGKIAMCTNFSNNASILVDRAQTKIWDCIGYTAIPQHMPVSAGWTLSVSNKSRQKEQALKFIEWIMSPELASAFTTMGGFSTIRAVYENNRLLQLYPWLDLVKKEYPTARQRDIPAIPGADTLDILYIESVVSDVISKCYMEDSPARQLLINAHEELCRYAEGKGYPRNPALT